MTEEQFIWGSPVLQELIVTKVVMTQVHFAQGDPCWPGNMGNSGTEADLQIFHGEQQRQRIP